MGLIQTLEPWYEQPQEAAPSTGDTRRLIYGHNRAGIDDAVWTPQGTPEFVVGPLGPAQRFTAASSQGLWAPISDVPSNNLTLYFVGRRTTTATVNDSLIALSAPSGNQRTLLYLAASGGNVRLSLFVGNAGNFRQVQCSAVPWANTTDHIVFVGRVWGTTHDNMDCAYIDAGAVQQSIATAAGTVTAGAQTRVSVGGYYNDGAWVGGFWGNWDVTAALVLPYSVSNDERDLMLRDPLYWLRWVQPRTVDIPYGDASALPTLYRTPAGLVYGPPEPGAQLLSLNPAGSLHAGPTVPAGNRPLGLTAGSITAGPPA